jgi:hypothetical protein
MKTLIILLLPLAAFAQQSAAVLLSLPVIELNKDTLHDTLAAPKKKTIPEWNYTDSLGIKQGKWLFLGSDFPNSGVASGNKLEEGSFTDNERTGLWYRFGPKGEIKAVMRYITDPKTRTGVRDQFYYYTYHSNGALNRKPEIGKCSTASDFYIYDEAGVLVEAEKFDQDCNTAFKLQRIQKGELDSAEVFKVSPQLKEASVNMQSSKTLLSLDQNGEYCVDYDHRLFQIGTFTNGVLQSGREIETDEMMRPQVVRYFENGKVVRQLQR